MTCFKRFCLKLEKICLDSRIRKISVCLNSEMFSLPSQIQEKYFCLQIGKFVASVLHVVFRTFTRRNLKIQFRLQIYFGLGAICPVGLLVVALLTQPATTACRGSNFFGTVFPLGKLFSSHLATSCVTVHSNCACSG